MRIAIDTAISSMDISKLEKHLSELPGETILIGGKPYDYKGEIEVVRPDSFGKLKSYGKIVDKEEIIKIEPTDEAGEDLDMSIKIPKGSKNSISDKGGAGFSYKGVRYVVVLDKNQ